MNVPPGAPPPPMAVPPPPPPAQGSSVWKWVLIGCGVIVLLGVLACGGCTLAVYMAVKKAAAESMEQLKPVIQQHPIVKEKVGTIQTLEPKLSGFSSQQTSRGTILRCTVAVAGDKGRGTIAVKLRTTHGEPDAAIAVLNFRDEAGKETPIGIWKGHGGQWTPLQKEPDEPND